MTDWINTSYGVKDGMLEAHEKIIRDQFAMAALQGMNIEYMDIIAGFTDSVAERAYVMADAMMKARSLTNRDD